jgi:hypothetical protein
MAPASPPFSSISVSLRLSRSEFHFHLLKEGVFV